MATTDQPRVESRPRGEWTDAVELEIERRFNRRYVYGSTLLPRTHYRASTTRSE